MNYPRITPSYLVSVTMIPNKTQLLISVTSIEEAQIALENGADIIDLKDPSAGALGALPLELVSDVVTYVRNYDESKSKVTSATIGDTPMQPAMLFEQVSRVAATGVDIVKIGFFEAVDYQSCLDVLKPLAFQGLKLIAVLFAEMTYPKDLILAIRNAHFMGVMLDTAEKNGKTLLDYYPKDRRERFAKKIHENQMQLGFAGSLRIEHMTTIKDLSPSYIGFRGGVCNEHQRNLKLDAIKVRAVRNTLKIFPL